MPHFNERYATCDGRSFEFWGHFPAACLSHKQGSMQRRGSIGVARAVQVSTKGSAVDTEEWNKQARETRLQHLEAQALETIRKTVDSFERPAFPCALIAGDVVCIHSYPLLCFCLSVCTV